MNSNTIITSFTDYNLELTDNGLLWCDLSNNNIDQNIDKRGSGGTNLTNILEKNKINYVISGHQDMKNINFIFKDGIIDSSNSNYVISDYDKYANENLYTLKEIKDMNQVDNFKSKEINLDNDNIVALTIATCTVSKKLSYDMYGIFSKDLVEIFYKSSCNSDQLSNCNGFYNINSESLDWTEDQINFF